MSHQPFVGRNTWDETFKARLSALLAESGLALRATLRRGLPADTLLRAKVWSGQLKNARSRPTTGGAAPFKPGQLMQHNDVPATVSRVDQPFMTASASAGTGMAMVSMPCWIVG